MFQKIAQPVLLLTLVLIAGCITPPERASQLPVRHGGPQVRPVSEPPPPAQVATPPATATLPTVETPPPPPPQTNSFLPPGTPASPPPGRKVALILGPGGARSFAHIGVLRELERHHIPIDAIVGLEWGAIPAALYAQEGRANDVEWQMFKMKADVMPSSGLLKSNMEPQSTDAMVEFLKSAFADKQTSTSRVRFMCPYTTHEGERTGWANNGKLKDLVALCVPYTPLLEPRTARAAPFAAADAALALRHQGYTDIVMVNVLGPGALLAPQKFADGKVNEILWSEIRASNRTMLQQSNWPIEISARNMGMSGLSNARELMAQGQKAAAPVAERMAISLGLINAN